MAYRVLIVDDDKAIREGLSEVIEWQEYGFEVADKLKDGEEAIAYLSSHHADVVLADIMMTFVSGLGLARFIYERGLDCKVVLISGHQEFEWAKEALRYQVFDYLLKPTDLDEVYHVLGRLKSQLDREREQKDGGDRKREREQEHGQEDETGKDCNKIRVTGSETGRNRGQAEGRAQAVGLKSELPHETGNNPAERVPEEAERRVITLAKQHIQEHLIEDLTLQQVAELIYLNPVYFSRLFKQETGVTFSDYLISCRMEKAAELLKNSHLKIYSIAQSVGYKDIRHFYKVFKKHTGHTPTEYRELR
ncbi:MAG: hypothetical protein K0R57_4004 [Paenibacillaceae bacterium]|jgi:two-component system response regulator YesN|nr:hypothetical protein [Paenibacillaceae bacterium]